MTSSCCVVRIHVYSQFSGPISISENSYCHMISKSLEPAKGFKTAHIPSEFDRRLWSSKERLNKSRYWSQSFVILCRMQYRNGPRLAPCLTTIVTADRMPQCRSITRSYRSYIHGNLSIWLCRCCYVAWENGHSLHNVGGYFLDVRYIWSIPPEHAIRPLYNKNSSYHWYIEASITGMILTG